MPETPSKETAAVGLVRNSLGLLEIDARVDGVSVRLLVDTGASSTVLNRAAAERLGLRAEASHKTAGCMGGSAAVETATTERFEVAGSSLGTRTIAVIDLGGINDKLAKGNCGPVDGILGADVLAAAQAVIDYGAARLSLVTTS